jgi:prepilin-type N-terminal cleavage/methylation domain-containing protein
VRRGLGLLGGAGFTLVELLLVMGIIGVMLGTGLGMVASLNPAERTAIGLVQSTIRAANNSAIASSAPARVLLDTKAGTLRAESMQVVGTWRFDTEDLSGAFGHTGSIRGAAGTLLGEAGYRGKCLDFVGTPRSSRVEFGVSEDPAFNPRLGFHVEVAVKLAGYAATTLMDMGGVLLVEVGPRGELAATFVAEAVGETGARAKGPRIALRTGAGALRLERWSRVSISYDRRFLVLAVDGVELARRPETAGLWRIHAPLSLSGGAVPFPGALDELVISVVAASETFTLAGGVQFGADAPGEILFVPGGGLDPTFHRGALTIPLEFLDGYVEEVRVGRYGTVE